MDDLISVIVPVYNVASYLERCIKSIVAQTYRNLEIILVDDGSTDNSGQICDSWHALDSRICVIHKKNAGLGMARNSGMERSTGKYLMFVDSDDYLNCDAVRMLYQRIVLDGTDIAVGNGASVNEAGEKIGDLYAMVEDAVCTQQEILGKFHGIPCMAWAKLYSRDIIQGLTYPTLSCGEDLGMLLDIVFRCRTVSLCSEIVYYYTQRTTSIVHTLNDKKLFDSTISAVHVCKKLAEASYWKAAKRFFTAALFRAVDMKDPIPARKLFAGTFPWYMQMKLIEWNLHTVIRWVALYIPAMHRMLKKRHSCA